MNTMDHLNSIYNAARKASGDADAHDSIFQSAKVVEVFIKEHTPETPETPKTPETPETPKTPEGKKEK